MDFGQRLHTWAKRHRTVVLWAVVGLIVSTAVLVVHLPMREEIDTMLPRQPARLAEAFRLLQRAPFARRIVISIERPAEIPVEDLLTATDDLSAALRAPLFSRVTNGPAEEAGLDWLLWLAAHLPHLATDGDYAQLQEGLAPDSLRHTLRESYQTLLAPEGMGMAQMVQRDPLAWRTQAMRKLRHVNMIPNVRLEDGHFVTADRRHALILAETGVPVTDFRRGQELVAALDAAIRDHVPAPLQATVLSAHRYSVANATAARRDLVVVLIGSTLALALLFLVFLRSWQAIFVFMVPLCGFLAAAVGTSLVFRPISAITLGFGAVLLGISVDFGLHVYFALRQGGPPAGRIVGALIKPLLLCCLTTMAAFGVLLSSTLPAQRQLALFAIIGLATTAVLALVVLPLLIRPGSETAIGWSPSWSPTRHRVLIGGFWLLLMLACALASTRLRVSGNLQELSVRPPDAVRSEAVIEETWGAIRGRAMLFSKGRDLEEALQRNDEVFGLLSVRGFADQTISLAAILPAQTSQHDRLGRWGSFWQGNRLDRFCTDLRQAAGEVGFSPDAFDGFLQSVAEPPETYDIQALRDVGLGDLVDATVVSEPQETLVVSLVPASAVAALRDVLPDGVRPVSPALLQADLSRAIRHDFARFLAIALVIIGGLLLLVLRSARLAAIAMVPVLSGILFMFGAMAVLGLSLNLFNLVSAILIIGVGVDYGIFMLHHTTDGNELPTRRAVLVSGLTTLAGFGVLILARHPALHAIGTSVSLGLVAALVAALLVVPVLAPHRVEPSP
ncbi:MAG: MMPL family transporter [Victivallales bacterium]|jgi:uncharacterized protein|nr:MMPL family transporter [Victivallales bacterium]